VGVRAQVRIGKEHYIARVRRHFMLSEDGLQIIPVAIPLAFA
jgi:hypothetical protein